MKSLILANYIITWIFGFIMALSALWAMIKYVEPFKHLKYCFPHKFIRQYISLCSFNLIDEQNNNFAGNLSPYFESIESGLYNKILQIKSFKVKNGISKIVKYVSEKEKSTLYVFYSNNCIVSVCPQSRLLCGQTLHFLA